MPLVTSIINLLGQFIINVISALGYFGIFILMMFESMVVPIPSELVMPFAGFLISQNKFSFLLIILFSSLGSITGSLMSYYIGKYGGNAFIKRYGKYFLLDEHDLKKTEAWFKKSGERTIFISRFIPVVRHLISIPAGIGKMNLTKFSVYTLIGATIWNTFLAYLGYLLGENWESVKKYSEPLSIISAVILVILAIYFIYRHIKHKKSTVPNANI